jgi:hypothetical protein
VLRQRENSGQGECEQRQQDRREEQCPEERHLSARDFKEIATFQFHPHRHHQEKGDEENTNIQDGLHDGFAIIPFQRPYRDRFSPNWKLESIEASVFG